MKGPKFVAKYAFYKVRDISRFNHDLNSIDKNGYLRNTRYKEFKIQAIIRLKLTLLTLFSETTNALVCNRYLAHLTINDNQQQSIPLKSTMSVTQNKQFSMKSHPLVRMT